ncbi:ribose-phosphate diphosphokinase, partial [Candidatus Woesearchaeota archaeon]|nr:ribose-phosphate diphosphokinase [Candidatus Woesearchaeota archaeon]
TMIEAAKTARKMKAVSVTAIGVHGLFVENAIKKMDKYFDEVITTNCIKHSTNKIDMTPLLLQELRKEKR